MSDLGTTPNTFFPALHTLLIRHTNIPPNNTTTTPTTTPNPINTPNSSSFALMNSLIYALKAVWTAEMTESNTLLQ